MFIAVALRLLHEATSSNLCLTDWYDDSCGCPQNRQKQDINRCAVQRFKTAHDMTGLNNKSDKKRRPGSKIVTTLSRLPKINIPLIVFKWKRGYSSGRIHPEVWLSPAWLPCFPPERRLIRSVFTHRDCGALRCTCSPLVLCLTTSLPVWRTQLRQYLPYNVTQQAMNTQLHECSVVWRGLCWYIIIHLFCIARKLARV